ncbi:RNA-binding domain superfamily [Arabidopsis thaliana x Arabidopsis arenosa]|uniref:RNA-binding domain superfamily n=1 Tax=Arabidopsis thaliana x Arabidopsis arenosa TaxID=1240361 RepID=A0A8T1XIJ9_9BRAS|nr:RNA-binding domain superfamily [Arabidopsis thaliana x Arabidopsis arenosa]
MEKSSVKGQESLEWKLTNRLCTISVEGYDTSLHEYPLKLTLRKHFASCGKIALMFVPKDFQTGILKSPLFIYFWGKDARDKALQLSGSDVGGWNVVVKPVPRKKDHRDPAGFNRFEGARELMVKVYDLPSSVGKIDFQIELCKHFSSCGEVTCVTVFVHGTYDHQRNAIISIMGQGCVEKAQELSGQRNAQGWNIVVDSVVPLSADKRKPTGCEHPSIVLERIKKAKMEKER